MPKYLIKREIPGAGKMTPEELQAVSQKSCAVLRGTGPAVQWLQSYVTDDKLYCVYLAPDKDAILRHAREDGFPANFVAEVRGMIDPSTAAANAGQRAG